MKFTLEPNGFYCRSKVHCQSEEQWRTIDKEATRDDFILQTWTLRESKQQEDNFVLKNRSKIILTLPKTALLNTKATTQSQKLATPLLDQLVTNLTKLNINNHIIAIVCNRRGGTPSICTPSCTKLAFQSSCVFRKFSNPKRVPSFTFRFLCCSLDYRNCIRTK